MKKPIDKTKIDNYMLGGDDYGNIYLMKSKGEVKITPTRAIEWLDAGIMVFDRSREAMREYIQEQMKKGEKMKSKVIPNWTNKPLTVSDLLKICKNAVDNGLGDKYVFISQDDEGNGFHALFYSFTTEVKDYADLIYQVNEEDLEDIIILG